MPCVSGGRCSLVVVCTSTRGGTGPRGLRGPGLVDVEQAGPTSDSSLLILVQESQRARPSCRSRSESLGQTQRGDVGMPLPIDAIILCMPGKAPPDAPSLLLLFVAAPTHKHQRPLLWVFRPMIATSRAHAPLWLACSHHKSLHILAESALNVSFAPQTCAARECTLLMPVCPGGGCPKVGQ